MKRQSLLERLLKTNYPRKSQKKKNISERNALYVDKPYYMNLYQQKWIDLLRAANIPGWKIEPQDENIYIEMPHVTDLKLIRDNLPSTLAAMSLDINEPHERLKFMFHNGHENFEYMLNPAAEDLEGEN